MSTAKPDIVTPEQWRAAREALLVHRPCRPVEHVLGLLGAGDRSAKAALQVRAPPGDFRFGRPGCD
jgi:hypothetical protein